MFPAIADGDIVEVHPEGSHSAGDVVLLEGEDSIRVHRVMSSAGEQIVTRGDSCFESDAAGKSDSILGRVSAVITDTGRHAPHTLRTRLRQILSRLRGSELLAFRVKL
jgi:SOS-response transcriptional repressor LexA